MSAKITLMPGRGKAAKRNTKPRKPGKRGKCSGWTFGAARRNADFLGSIIPQELTGYGVACSLTVRTCPETPEAWADCRDILLKRLARMGLLRFHWVTEWQVRTRHDGRPVPHLHGIFYFEEPSTLMAAWVVKHWLAITSGYGSQSQGQDAKSVPRLEGWLQYLAKHGSRSISNKQRASGMIPEAWETAGRLWGRGGEWPTRSQAVIADDRVFYQYRRLLRNHDKAQAQTRLRLARQWKNPKQEKTALTSIRYSRQLLKFPNRRGPRDRQPMQHAQLVNISRARPVTGYLGEFAVDRWLHSLPPNWWRYEEDADQPPRRAYSDVAPPDAETSRIGAAGGAV